MTERKIKGAFSSRATKGRVKKTVDNALRYLDSLAESGNYSAAARTIDITTSTANAWRKDDGWKILLEGEEYTFGELCVQAQAIFADSVEAEVVRRAVDGYDEPVVYKGQIMSEIDPVTGKHTAVTVKKFSDRLLEILLKGQKPKYSGDTQVNINAGENGGVLVVPESVSPDAWSKVIKDQQADARQGKPLGKEDADNQLIDPTS